MVNELEIPCRVSADARKIHKEIYDDVQAVRNPSPLSTILM